MGKAKAKTLEAVYIGRRLGNGDKVAQVFELLPSRKEIWFRGIRGLVIGYAYETNGSQMKVRPQMTPREREDNPQWDALDALVDARNAEKTAERKVKAMESPALKDLISRLAVFTEAVGFFEANVLVRHLVRQALKQNARDRAKKQRKAKGGN